MFKVGDRVRVNWLSKDKELEGLETTIILEDFDSPAIDVTEFRKRNPGTTIGWFNEPAGIYEWYVGRYCLDPIPTPIANTTS